MSRVNWLSIGLIIVLGVVAYANSFGNPFIWDDENLVVNNPYIKDIRLIKNLFTKDLGYGTQFSNFYRPLQSLTFELDYYLWGLNPFGFHLTNVLLHIACALVIYFLLAAIFRNRNTIALVTAILFLVHPIQTESVTYISGRADSLVGLFILLSLFFYIKSRNQLLAVVSFIFALLAKETALVLPLLIVLYEVSFSKKTKWQKRLLPHLVVALVYIGLRMTVLNFLDRPIFLSDTNLYLRTLTSAKVFALYLGLLVLPLNLHMERTVPIVSSLWDKDVLFALILFLLIGILILRSYRYSRGYFFASIWFFLNLLPVSNIVPLNANMAEHWLYLPSIGFFLLVALAFDKLLRRTKAFKICSVILLIILVGVCSLLTAMRNRQWHNPQRFFQSILYYVPKSVEAHNCLGAIYQSKGWIDLAINEYKQAVKSCPQNYKSYGNLGSALRQKKEYDLAIAAYKRGLQLRPDIPGLYNNLGNVYSDMGSWDKAREQFQKALQLYPEFALCRINLAGVYLNKGDVSSAIKEYEKAIALNPNLFLARYNLALAYYQRKQYDLARENFFQALKLNPEYKPTREFLNRLEELR